MNKFSIKIDLSTFFNDERKMVLLMVDPDVWTNVKCLQNRVETLFDVKGCRFLNDGCFLPPEESIEILRFCKELTAFVPKESLRKRKKSKIGNIEIDIVEIDEAPNDNNEETKKKRKYRSLDVTDFASSTPNNTKRLKNCMGTINVTIKEEERRINKSSEISSTSNDQMPPPTSASKEKIQRASMKDQPNSPEENKTVVSQDNFAVNEQVSRKSKRKSTVNNSGYNDDITSNEEPISKTKATENTKHKLSKSLEDNTIEISKPTVRISTLPSSTFINESRKSDKKKRLSNNPFRDQSLNLNHIHFNESGEISTTTNTIQNKENEKSVDTIVIYQCDLNLIDPKEPRIFSIRSGRNIDDKAINKNPKKPVIEIQENILIKPILERNNSSQEFENTLEAKSNVTSLADTSSLISNAKENTGNVSDRSLNNTNNTCTKIDKYPAETEDQSELKICETDTISTANDETTTDKTKIEESTSHTADIYDDNDDDDLKPENESSILSVDSQLDCVDLSIDVDEEDVDVKNKNGKDSEKLKTFEKVHVQDISISDTSDVEEVIDLNETEDQNNSSLNITCRRSSLSSIIKINRIIAYCKDTKELPDVGDVMIFKIPFTNRQGNPDCTKFLAGRIERIQQRTKTAKILILDGHSELFYVPAKYLDKYIDNSLCEDKYIQIKFGEMIQPRILPKNKLSLL